jgi:cell division septum initiation protein DivIVA
MQERISSLQQACNRLRGELTAGPALSYGDLSMQMDELQRRADDAHYEIERLQSVERAQRDEIGYWRQRQQEIDESLTKVRAEADRILRETRMEAEQLSQTAMQQAREVEQDARIRADQILSNARIEANEMLSRALATSESAHRRLLDAQERIAHLDDAHETLRASLRTAVEDAESTLRRIDMGAMSIDATAAPLAITEHLTPTPIPIEAFDAVQHTPVPVAEVAPVPEPAAQPTLPADTEPAPVIPLHPPEAAAPTAMQGALRTVTTIKVEAHPFLDFSSLARFESAIARLPYVADVHIDAFSENVAELIVSLGEARTAHEVVGSLPGFDIDVESAADDSIVVMVSEPPYSAAA